MCHLEDEIRFPKRIADRPSAIGCRKIKLIRHRTAPIEIALKSSQSVAYPKNTAHVASIAIGVPATGVDDGLCKVEVALAVEQAENHQAVIWNDMAVAAILVIAVLRGEFCTGSVPILTIRGMPGSNVRDQTIDDRITGNEGDGSVKQFIEIIFGEGLSNQSSDDLRAIDSFTIVADTCGALSQAGSQTRVSWSNHPPTINEDLCPDLFRHHFAVPGD